MSPEVIAWIVAVVSASIAAKFLGLLFKKNDLGIVAGPLVGVIGGIALWRISLIAIDASGSDFTMAGISAALGGIVAYLLVAIIKSRKA